MNIEFDARNGDRGVCLVDGIVRPDIAHGRTGWNGFAMQIVRDSRGTPQVIGGEIKTRVIRGNVQLRNLHNVESP